MKAVPPSNVARVLLAAALLLSCAGRATAAATSQSAPPLLINLDRYDVKLPLWSGKDPIIEEPRRQSLREALPAATVKVFPGLGHNPFWEESQVVATVINGFLNAKP